jgi:hypothetical protein
MRREPGHRAAPFLDGVAAYHQDRRYGSSRPVVGKGGAPIRGLPRSSGAMCPGRICLLPRVWTTVRPQAVT